MEIAKEFLEEFKVLEKQGDDFIHVISKDDGYEFVAQFSKGDRRNYLTVVDNFSTVPLTVAEIDSDRLVLKSVDSLITGNCICSKERLMQEDLEHVKNLVGGVSYTQLIDYIDKLDWFYEG